MPTNSRIFQFEELADADLYVGAVYLGGTRGTAADDPLAKLLPVGNQGGFRHVGSPTKRTVRLSVLYTSGAEVEWPDELDRETGVFTYFGDNRKPGRNLLNTSRGGNIVLRDAFTSAHSTPSDRLSVPPFLLFEKAGIGRAVRFIGLLVPCAPTPGTDDALTVVRHRISGQEFENYRARFTVLDTKVVPRGWLTAILAGADTTNVACPRAWREWSGGQDTRADSPHRDGPAHSPDGAGRAELLDALHGLTVHRQDGKAAFYQYVVLLWAISRPPAARLTAFSAARESLRGLLAPFAVSGSDPDPAMPWIALADSPWWEIGLPDANLRQGLRPRDVVRRCDPRAGLSTEAHALVFGDAKFRRQAVEAIAEIGGNSPELDALLDRLGLRGEDGIPDSRSAIDTDGGRSPRSGLAASVTDLPPEAQIKEVFDRSSPEPGTAERREAALQQRYRAFLEAAGHSVCRKRIVVSGEANHLYTDLFNVTTGELIEAKSDSGRTAIRLALGQILDYARHVLPTSAAVLVPDKPAADLTELLLRNRIAVVWEDEPNSFQRRDPEARVAGSGLDPSCVHSARE